MNPFANALRDATRNDAERHRRAPCFVANLPDPYGPVSSFDPKYQEFFTALIMDGSIDCLQQAEEFYISASDIAAYSAPGSDFGTL